MKTSTFILICIGAHESTCDRIDHFCEEFDIELAELDVLDSVESNCRNVADGLFDFVFWRIAEKFSEEYGLTEDEKDNLFSWHIDALDTHFFFNKQYANTVKDLRNLIEQYQHQLNH